MIQFDEDKKMKPLEKGISVTDSCISIEETRELLFNIFETANVLC